MLKYVIAGFMAMVLLLGLAAPASADDGKKGSKTPVVIKVDTGKQQIPGTTRTITPQSLNPQNRIHVSNDPKPHLTIQVSKTVPPNFKPIEGGTRTRTDMGHVPYRGQTTLDMYAKGGVSRGVTEQRIQQNPKTFKDSGLKWEDTKMRSEIRAASPSKSPPIGAKSSPQPVPRYPIVQTGPNRPTEQQIRNIQRAQSGRLRK